MNLKDCVDGHLICLRLDQKNLFIEFEVVSARGEQLKWVGFNSTSSPIAVEFRGAHFDARLHTTGNQATLGEIESTTHLVDGFELEGDFGVISVTADRFELVASS